MMLNSLKNWFLSRQPRLRRTRCSLLPRAWRLGLEALEERTMPNAVPTAALLAPSTNFLGQDVNMSVSFTNTGSTVGYGPYVDVYLPATGADGSFGLTHYDGITFNPGSGNFLGTAVTTTVLTFDAAGHATHPYAVNAAGNPIIVNGTIGDQLLVFQLPFGSYTPGQIPAVVNFTAHVSNLADVGTPLTLKTDAGFQFGNDPLNNPGSDSTIVGPQTTQTLTPTLLKLTKTYIGPEDETATGPNFPRQYKIDVSIAPGQTITNLDITDQLPSNLQYVRVDATTINGSATAAAPRSLPSTSIPGGTLTERFTSVTGTGGAADAEVLYTFFVPEKDAGGNPVLNLTTGAFAPSSDTASSQGSWIPSDTFDLGGTVTSNVATHTLTDKSIAIQKSVTDLTIGATGATPGDTLEYKLNIQISDYFAFQNLITQDTFTDGQQFDASFVPTLAVNGDTFTLGSSNFHGGNYGLAFGTFDPVTGGNRLTFNLSNELVSAGRPNGQLLGGAMPTTGTGGAIPPANPAYGPTTAVITFHTKILNQYNVLTSPTADPYVKQGDVMSDSVTVSGDVLNYANLAANGNTRTDNSAASVQIQRGVLTKIIYAINGVVAANPDTGYTSGVQIAAGDVLTYRLRYSVNFGTAETIALTDFLPLPVLKAGSITTFDNTGPTAVAPVSGHAVLGPNDTLTAHTGGSPGISTDATANSLIFTYATVHDPLLRPATIDILFSAPVSSDPFADKLFLTNEVHESEGSTNNGGAQADSIVQIQLTEPLLNITKGAVASDDTTTTSFSPAQVGPVTFNPPGGSTTTSFTGTINSTNLLAKPVQSNLNGIQAGDRVRFAIVVQNTGTGLHGAFQVAVKDTLPAGFTMPVGGYNLQVRDGTGALKTVTNVGGGSGLFGLGILVSDPNAVTGAIAPYDPANGQNILVITYDLLAQAAVEPKDVLQNTATLTNYTASSSPVAGNFVPNGLTDTAQVTVEPPSVSKQLLNTSIVNANNSKVQAVIGELATYQVTVTIPQGTMQNTLLIDTLPAGLAFVSFGGLTNSDPAHVTLSGPPSADTTTLGSSNGHTIRFNLGTVTNTDVDSTVAETLTFTYTTVVLDIGTNVNNTTLSNSAQLSWNGQSLAPVVDSELKVVEPKLKVTKTPSNGGGQFGSTITYTLVVSQTAGTTADAFNVTVSDALPADETFVPGSFVYINGLTPDVGSSSMTYNAGTRTLSAHYANFPLGGASTIAFQVTLDQTVTPGEKIFNTATTTFTSLPGPNPGQLSAYNASATERTGAGGVDNYLTSGSSTVTVNLPALSKSLVSTSEPSTSGNNVAIGEVVRYRLLTVLPQGTAPNFQLVDRLPVGMSFLNDGKAKVAFVSDVAGGGTITSGNATIGTSPEVQGDQTTVNTIVPSFLLPPGTITGGVGDGGAVTFSLGQLVNSEHDGNTQYVIVEFDALVDNTGSDTAGANLQNNYVVDVSGAQSGVPSNNITVTVAEPKINVSKTTSLVSGQHGDSTTYTVVFSNTGTATGFDLELVDNVPATYLTLNPASVNFSTPGGTTITNNSAGNRVDLLLDQLLPTGSVTVTYTGQLTQAVTPALNIINTGDVSYTSLPGANGTTGATNPLGSNAPGGPGTPTGERTGSGGVNSYHGTGSATIAVTTPGPLTKTITSVSVPQVSINPLNAGVLPVVIGETVTYNATFTLNHATFPTLALTDALPAGLSPVSSQVISIGANLSGSPLGVGAAGTVSGNNVSFQFNGVVDTGNGALNAADNIVVQIVALVTTAGTNISGKTLTNSVSLNYGPGTLTATKDIQVLEPKLKVTKTTSKALVDAEQTFTYTVVVANLAANGSTAPAFEVDMNDLLPSGESLVPGSVTATAGSIVLGNGVADTSIDVTDAQLDLGSSVTITFNARVDGPPKVGAPAPGTALINTCNATFTSIPGGGGNARNGSGSGSSTVTVNTNSISGFVYVDANNNGVKNGGEAAIGNVTITLTGKDHLNNPVLLTTTTNGAGAYSFTKLRPSDPTGYTIIETQPAGFFQGKNQAGNAGNPFGGVLGAVGNDSISTIVIPANSNQTQPNYNFGELVPARISGTVYEDKDGSGNLNAGDLGIGSVSVTLTGTDDLGAPVSTTVTTSLGSGAFSFGGLRPSDASGYQLTETQPAGYVQAFNLVGTVNGSTDGVLVPVDGLGSVTISSGQNGLAYNFGEVLPVSISGNVYEDKDASNSLTGADAGIGSASITLTGTNNLGQIVSVTTTTTASGAYSITTDGLGNPLAPGTYKLTETQPNGYLQAANTVGTVNGTTDGSLLPIDNINAVLLRSGQSGIAYNFGEVQPVSLSGTVYEDKDASGSLTASDAGIGSVTISLSGTNNLGQAVSVTAVSKPDGTYSFTTDGSGNPLAPGTYLLTESQPVGNLQATNTVGLVNGSSDGTLVPVDKISTIIVNSNQSGTGYNFGEVKPLSLSGTVYEDNDASGTLTLADAGIGSVTISLSGINNLGQAVTATAVTQPDGTYSLTTDTLGKPLAPGTYQLTESQPAGYLQAMNTVGTVNGTVDGSLNPVDRIAGITATSGQSGVGYNFGEVRPISLGGMVYEDKNSSGSLDAGDAGIGGVTITLSGTNNLAQAVTVTVVTKPDGTYTLTTDGSGNPLAPGTYTLAETQPAGYLQAVDTLGTVNGSTMGTLSAVDQFGSIVIRSGQSGLSYNYGEVKPVSLAGTVYEDKDLSNTLSARDTGLGSVTITLSGTNNLGQAVAATAVTLPNGTYSITTDGSGNLLDPGIYNLSETQPLGYLQAFNTVGTVNGSADGSLAANDQIGSIVLSSSQSGLSYNFGEVLPVSIDGTVYDDKDASNSLTVADMGIGSVSVTLTGTNNLGQAITVTATTTPGGTYNFTTDSAGKPLAPGTYMLMEAQPSGYLQAANTVGTVNGSPDGSLVPVDSINAVLLKSGQSGSGYNFGEVQAVGLSGTVYEDKDGSGSLTASDLGLGNVTITLSGTNNFGQSVTATTITLGDGSYSLLTDTLGKPLAPGTFTITETQPAGYLQGFNTVGLVNGSSDGVLVPVDAVGSIVLKSGQSGSGYNFGEVRSVTLSGMVYEDKTSTGSLFAGDPGIGNVTITLTGTNNLNQAVAATTITQPDGTYSFSTDSSGNPLAPGNYSLMEQQPAGYLQAFNTVGTVNGASAGTLSPVDKISAILFNSVQQGVGYNFGEVLPVTLNGTVYEDKDANGTLSAGDSGIGSVTVNLTGSNNLGQAVTATTTTLGDGSYHFTVDNSAQLLAPGTYQITETQPAGYLQASNTVGTVSGAVDGTLVPVDRLGSILVNSNQTGVGYNFGEVLPITLSGTVYEDQLVTGSFAAADPRLGGVSLTLSGTNNLGNLVTASVVTKPDGSYSFTTDSAGNLLVPGTYSLTEAQPGGYLQGTNTVGTISGITIGSSIPVDQVNAIVFKSGQNGVGYNFGEILPSTINGVVYLDGNNNGIPEGGETGLGNVTVTLSGTDDRGQPVSFTMTTAGNGSYSFPGLRPGNYAVTETQPAGYFHGLEARGGVVLPGSSVTHTIPGITLISGSAAGGNNFGELLPASVSGFVYFDLNRNDVRDRADGAVSQVTVLLSGTNDQGTAISQSFSTDTNGFYSFSNLRPGTYSVTEVPPVGYTPGATNVGSASGTVANQQINNVVLTSGLSAINNNFGEIGTTISGRVLVDGGPTGLGGVTIQLRDPSGNLFTTTTTNDGSYSFTNLPSGNYTVTELQPNGYGLGSSALLNPLLPPTGLVNQDFIVTTGSLSGLAFADNNNDSLLNGPDQGLGGLTITLTGTDVRGTSVSQTTTTGSDGSYRFSGLLAGAYSVSATPPANYFDGKDTAGTVGGIIGRNVIGSATLAAATQTTGYNFAFIPQRGVSGSVFLDDNNNGRVDPGEPGIGGVVITLTGVDVLGHSVFLTTTTSGVGAYQFLGLAPGVYTLRESPPIGYDPGIPQPGVPAPAQVSSGLFANLDLRNTAFVALLYSFPHLQSDFAASLMTPSIVAPMTYSTYVSKTQLLGSQILQNPQLNVQADANFVNNLYQEVLGRPVDLSGVNYWVALLETGTSRYNVARAIWTSAEHRGLQVDQLYQHFLHRNPEAEGRQYWINKLVNGADEADLPRQFIESVEYQAHHSDNADFIESLYRHVLGRPSEASGMAYWVQVLNGGATRDDVLRGFLGSKESAIHILDQYFSRYLHRPADAVAENSWITPLETWNLGATTVASMILASDEFFAHPVGQ